MTEEDKAVAKKLFEDADKKLDEVYDEVCKLDEIVKKYTDRWEATTLHGSVVFVPTTDDSESGYSMILYLLEELLDYLGE